MRIISAQWTLFLSLILVISCQPKETVDESQPSAESTPSQVSTEDSPILEAYPLKVARALSEHEKQRLGLPSIPDPGEASPQRAAFAIARLKTWDHQPITVSFLAGQGNYQLRKMIADTANEWGRYGNVKFDFGLTSLGRFREWHATDHTFASDIRVAFTHGDGYWSLIGYDSSTPDPDHPDFTGAGLPSLNLDSFDSKLPSDWRATVLHEFGHALGFAHEFENPDGNCDSEIIWGDQTTGLYGYMLRIYGWPDTIVNAQMRTPLVGQQAYLLSPHDNKSIMHYEVPSRFCKHANSLCCAGKNKEISELDKQGLLEVYPFAASEQIALAGERKDMAAALIKLPDLSDIDEALAHKVVTASARLERPPS